MKTIPEQKIKDCLAILNKGENEKPIIKERLERLSFQLLHLLDEIEEFRRVVYCKDAAACRLDNKVLKILSGSIDQSGRPIERDIYFDAPCPAAGFIGSSNGWKNWKDRSGKSMR
ncbi:MAG: DUF4357 domain-containing protein [Planctomycetes bacterium]|nr:DUF4357 domain-containing protein [Planctomycetota bacterium]